ncbi:hypothetical protein BJY14_001995 [Actinomadura luteofluorescens]|uniref:Nuclear transport factor 2 family protein n=1 Tax=Actinomadura luteofluorescens TaxID=46163 RepID=A0A7Y9JEE1_9ACTN|nr:hypothetical protein [Actinomadura luteofluorescens]NYD46012.1 hypothetical protein [Actinomadura luteofluorescens]
MALRFTPRAGGALAVTALAMAFLASACGGDDKDGGDEVFRPPSPSPTSSAQQDTDPGAQEGIEGARAALQAFLRGQAAGDPAVCRYVAKDGDFLEGQPLNGDCPAGVRNTPHFLRPQERQALRTLTVKGGRLSGEEAVIPFSALHWTSGSMVERTLQSEFTLRHDGEVWQIVK